MIKDFIKQLFHSHSYYLNSTIRRKDIRYPFVYVIKLFVCDECGDIKVDVEVEYK